MDRIKQAARLKAAREERGLNQAQLAVIADIEESVMSRLEAGKREFTEDKIERLLAIGIDVNKEEGEAVTVSLPGLT